MSPSTPPSELSNEQLVALAHRTRQLLWSELAFGPLSISELARRITTNKGNVAHHLAALERVDLVRRGQRRTVRGGTEQPFERTAQHVRATRPGQSAREITATSLAAVSSEMAEDPAPNLHVRHLRMTAAQANALIHHLNAVLESLTPATPPEQKYGVAVGLWRRPAG